MSNDLTDKKPPAKPAAKKARTRLNELKFSPEFNPLLDPRQIPRKNKQVRTGRPRELIDASSGEVLGNEMAVIHTIEEHDDAHFVKVFAAGVQASFDLNRTATRVFMAVLQHYQSMPMSEGFADSVYLAWFGGGLFGQETNMSEKTYREGLRDLIDNGFLSPRTPNVYWVNPSMFFKGDRAAFIREYRRKTTAKKVVDDRQAALFHLNEDQIVKPLKGDQP